MRNIFALITFLFISSFVFAQEQTQRMVLGRCNLSQTGGSTNHWRLSGNFTDGAGLYESSDINVGDKVFFTDGGIGFLLPIDTVVSATPPSFTISVNKTGITAISSVPTTNSALICRGTSNHGLIPFTANVTDPDNQVLMEHTLYLIDSLLSLSGGGIDSTHVYGDTTFAYAGIDSFVVSIDQNAAEVPLATPINFGGVVTDTVQEALEVIDARLDSAFLLKIESSTALATTGTTNNYHTGSLGVGDFSSDNLGAKLHLYDVAQAILRISDEAASDTAGVAFVDFWRGRNTARLGRAGYLFNTDNDLYFSNESTGGGIKFRTNAVDKLEITPAGQLKASQYGLGAFAGTTAKVITVDASGNYLDDKEISDFGGVDSSLVRNDSVLQVLLDGSEIFSGINRANIDNGRIWYVSKSNPNCSVSAKVGDPQLPFCNPWQAVDSLQEGDIVIIYPARYFISDTGGGGDLTVTSNWQAGRQLYKDNVSWIATRGTIIENASSYNVAIFNTNGVVTTTSGKYCAFLGDATLKKTGGGRLDLTHDLTTTSAGNQYFEFYDADFGGAGFNDRTIDRIEVHCKSLYKYNNNLGDCTRTKYFVSKAQTYLQTANARPGMGLERAIDGGQIVIECDEFGVTGSGNGSVFAYAGSPSGNDSMYFEFKTKRLKFYSSATFTAGYSGKLWAKNSSGSTGNNKYFTIDIGEIVDLSSDTMPIFNITGAAFTTGAVVDVKIGKGYSAVSSLWEANVNSSAIWKFDVGLWTNGSSKPVFANYTASTSGELWISGNYISASAPVVRLLNARTTRIIDARFNCTNQTAILTNSVLSLRNVVLLSGSSAPIQNITTTPVSVNCMGVYSNSTVIDSDITEVVTPIVRNSNVN